MTFNIQKNRRGYGLLFVPVLLSIVMAAPFTSHMVAQASELQGDGREVQHSPSDDAEIRQTIHNYVNAFYQKDPSLIEKSVTNPLSKHGYFYSPRRKEYSPSIPMSYEEALEHSKTFYERMPLPENPRLEITIFEIMDKTASAKVLADWGQDYLHLEKTDNGWRITNVLWQSVAHE